MSTSTSTSTSAAPTTTPATATSSSSTMLVSLAVMLVSVLVLLAAEAFVDRLQESASLGGVACTMLALLHLHPERIKVRLGHPVPLAQSLAQPRAQHHAIFGVLAGRRAQRHRDRGVEHRLTLRCVRQHELARAGLHQRAAEVTVWRLGAERMPQLGAQSLQRAEVGPLPQEAVLLVLLAGAGLGPLHVGYGLDVAHGKDLVHVAPLACLRMHQREDSLCDAVLCVALS
mmetsp:Transcript_15032/g.45021  ORF Transcript_15032/g.45021 Transcript_15032/m.45021 type:complete len:229 (-) Transcript_15032:1748-2434(-)